MRPGVAAGLCLVLLLPMTVCAEPIGALAEREMRTLAEQFPGRMAGSERERAAAEYLAGRLADFGYAPSLQEFPVVYRGQPSVGAQARERAAMSQNVVAELAGSGDGLIIVGAHYDTSIARSEEQAQAGVGGPELEGVDDNASGSGVLLELARRLAGGSPEHSIRFIAFGAEEVGLLGARHVVAGMSDQQRERVLLMINIDSIITGDRLYVHAGPLTSASDPLAASARDELLEIAAGLDIELHTNPGLNADYPAGTGCCSDQAAFDEAGIPVVNLEATNWRLGNLDGFQQTEISEAFPAGESWHNRHLDRLDHLEAHLPEGRLSERPAKVVALLLALLRQKAAVSESPAAH